MLLLLVIGLAAGTGCRKSSVEDEAKRATSKSADALKGIGEGLKEQGERAGKAFGEGAGALLSGVAQGVEHTLLEKEVRVSEALKSKGVDVTAVHFVASGFTNGPGFRLYVVNTQALKASLLFKVYNQKEQEIARLSLPVDLPTEGGTDLTFVSGHPVGLASVKYFTLGSVELPRQ